MGMERLAIATRGRRKASFARRYRRPAFAGLVALGLVALVVALVVATGDARDHAFLHLLAGVACLALFVPYAFAWHPEPGSARDGFRSVLLLLLAFAAFGSFLESIGGAGYDERNVGRRIEVLTTLHDVALVFAPFLMVAVPLALVACLVVFAAWVVDRDRSALA